MSSYKFRPHQSPAWTMADSASASPLSSHASSEFADDVKTEDRDQSLDALPEHADSLMPPAKRQRTGMFSHRSTPLSYSDSKQDPGDISSDTSGDIPCSPPGEKLTQMQEDDSVAHEQVTICKWAHCSAGDLRNMDVLVSHIHDDHIGNRQKKYVCEWEGCPRLNMNHASGYALKAHMRSHTREKPFYCGLPECDRSFTRSDALAKHMRTVHETEALRPSDPIPRNHSTVPSKPQRLKLIVSSKPPPDSNSRGGVSGNTSIDDDATMCETNSLDLEPLPPASSIPFEYPPDIQFTSEELSMRSDQLFALLRRRVRWAEDDGAELREDIEVLEAKRKEEWQAKELVLANVMEGELANAVQTDMENVLKLKDDLPHPMLPIEGQTPWYRVPETEKLEHVL